MFFGEDGDAEFFDFVALGASGPKNRSRKATKSHYPEGMTTGAILQVTVVKIDEVLDVDAIGPRGDV